MTARVEPPAEHRVEPGLRALIVNWPELLRAWSKVIEEGGCITAFECGEIVKSMRGAANHIERVASQAAPCIPPDPPRG